MKKYGFVATGGGHRSFYTAGVLMWLKENGYPVVHINSNSSGNNITLDYLIWDKTNEELPPILNQTFRMNVSDIFEILTNFSGLKPSILNNGSYLFTVGEDKCRNSLMLNDEKRLNILKENLKNVKWDIAVTNLSKREKQWFKVNAILSQINEETLAKFMKVFIAGITTIPYFKAMKMNGDYYLEGGYIDNSPLRTIFQNPEVDEIITMDFTDYNYDPDLDEVYNSLPILSMFKSGIEMNVTVNDIELNLPNIQIIKTAKIINGLIKNTGNNETEINGKKYYYKPLHILKPANLKSMTISLGDTKIPKEYFELGKKEAEEYFSKLK